MLKLLFMKDEKEVSGKLETKTRFRFVCVLCCYHIQYSMCKSQVHLSFLLYNMLYLYPLNYVDKESIIK